MASVLRSSVLKLFSENGKIYKSYAVQSATESILEVVKRFQTLIKDPYQPTLGLGVLSWLIPCSDELADSDRKNRKLDASLHPKRVVLVVVRTVAHPPRCSIFG